MKEAKNYRVIVDPKTGEGVEKLRKFLMENFKNDNIWISFFDIWDTGSGQIDDEGYEDNERTPGMLSDSNCSFTKEELDQNGPQHIFGKTLEEKVESIIKYVMSKQCLSLNVHDVIDDIGYSSITLDVVILEENGEGLGFELGENVVNL